MLFISPPFGNYIEIKNCISIKGSFTLNERNGLFSQIIKTLRYSFKHKGWVNKIGLRNKGLDYAIKKYKNTNHIVSIAILNKGEIPFILKKIPNNMNIELNISCPNINKSLVNSGLKDFINKEREWCIVKLSPISELSLIDNLYQEGFRQFHCSNTIPIKEGGLSGYKIKEYNIRLIRHIKDNYKDCVVIGGGGIRKWSDIIFYKNLGCDNYSISSLFFNPIEFSIFYYNFISNNII